MYHTHLDAWQHEKELHSKVGELKHHGAALGAPLLLPVVEPVGDEAPADADERLLGHHLLAWQQSVEPQLYDELVQAKHRGKDKAPQHSSLAPALQVPPKVAGAVLKALPAKVVHVTPAL